MLEMLLWEKKKRKLPLLIIQSLDQTTELLVSPAIF